MFNIIIYTIIYEKQFSLYKLKYSKLNITKNNINEDYDSQK